METPLSSAVLAGDLTGTCELLETGAKVVFVATPNNPSATLVPLEELELLASKLNGILVVDEAYIDYATDLAGKPAGLAASFIPKLASHPNVLVLRTFSKSYSMAGARLGLMFASPELVTHMNKVKGKMPRLPSSGVFGRLGAVLGTVAVGGGLVYDSIYNVEAGHRAILFNSSRGIKR